MTADLIQILTEAIQNRQIITLVYGGYQRGVEPFTLGYSHRGTLTLSGFQVTGRSRSGGIPDWRRFDLQKMSQVEVHEEQFTGNRAGYNPRDQRMSRIMATV